MYINCFSLCTDICDIGTSVSFRGDDQGYYAQTKSITFRIKNNEYCDNKGPFNVLLELQSVLTLEIKNCKNVSLSLASM